MRKYTLVFSIVAHAVAVSAMIIVPALATEELPEPRRTTEWILVVPEIPAPPPPYATTAPGGAAIDGDPGAFVAARRDPARADRRACRSGGDGVDGGVTGCFRWSDFISSDELVSPPPPAPPRPKEPVHVGGRIQAPTKLVHVNPIYPPIPLAARKEGLVILEALIAEDGTVRDVKVLRTAALFDEAAVTAVRQWRFSPTLLNGEPVPIVMTVTVGFTMER